MGPDDQDSNRRGPPAPRKTGDRQPKLPDQGNVLANATRFIRGPYNCLKDQRSNLRVAAGSTGRMPAFHTRDIDLPEHLNSKWAGFRVLGWVVAIATKGRAARHRAGCRTGAAAGQVFGVSEWWLHLQPPGILREIWLDKRRAGAGCGRSVRLQPVAKSNRIGSSLLPSPEALRAPLNT